MEGREASPPPPPPPPPPPRRKGRAIPAAAKKPSSGNGWWLVAGVGLVGGAAFLYRHYLKEHSRESSEKKQSDLVRQYLEAQAETMADEEAKAVLAVERRETEEPKHEFRLDISRSGLATTLSFLLETKRMEERELIKTVRGGVYPQNYEDDLRRMRKEKQEMKRLIKRLKPA